MENKYSLLDIVTRLTDLQVGQTYHYPMEYSPTEKDIEELREEIEMLGLYPLVFDIRIGEQSITIEVARVKSPERVWSLDEVVKDAQIMYQWQVTTYRLARPLTSQSYNY